MRKALTVGVVVLLLIVLAGACLGFVVVPQMEHNIQAIDGAGVGGTIALMVALPVSIIAGVVVFLWKSRR